MINSGKAIVDKHMSFNSHVCHYNQGVSMTVLSPDGKYSSDKIENTAVIKWRVKYSFDKIENTAVIKWGVVYYNVAGRFFSHVKCMW